MNVTKNIETIEVVKSINIEVSIDVAKVLMSLVADVYLPKYKAEIRSELCELYEGLQDTLETL